RRGLGAGCGYEVDTHLVGRLLQAGGVGRRAGEGRLDVSNAGAGGSRIDRVDVNIGAVAVATEHRWSGKLVLSPGGRTAEGEERTAECPQCEYCSHFAAPRFSSACHEFLHSNADGLVLCM